MDQQKFYTIIGNSRFPYKLGINDKMNGGKDFNRSSRRGPEGFHFYKIEQILSGVRCGNKVCILSIPEGVHVVPFKGIFKADRIFIEKIIPVDIKSLVEAGADLHESGGSALFWAAEKGHLDIVKYLVGAGVNVHASNGDALAFAAYQGHLEIVKFLVESGAKLYTRNDPSLHRAVQNGRVEIIEYLVELGARIPSQDKFYAQSESPDEPTFVISLWEV